MSRFMDNFCALQAKAKFIGTTDGAFLTWLRPGRVQKAPSRTGQVGRVKQDGSSRTDCVDPTEEVFMAPQPFALSIPDADIADLKARLALTRFPDAAPGEPWAYGSSV